MSEKIKEIKRLLELMKTADWSEFKGYIGKIEQMLNNVEKPKRKPLSDGTLELADEELDEINNLMKGKKAWNPHDGEISGVHKIIKIRLNIDDYIFCKYSGYDDEFASERKVVDIKAIAYLLERFELIKED